jgi:hypothetical protein
MSTKRMLGSSLLLLFTAALAVLAIGREEDTRVHATPPPHRFNVAGQWILIGHSSQDPASYTILEMNLAAGSSSTTLFESKRVIFIRGIENVTNQKLIELSGLQNACGQDEFASDSIHVAFSTPTEASFTLVGDGRLGSDSTGHFVFDPTGSALIKGDYALSDCQFVDSGLLVGRRIHPFSGNYSGFYGDDKLNVTIHEGSDYGVEIQGTNGTDTVSLYGKALGGTFSVTGTDGFRSTEIFGVYDPIADDFLLYNATFDAVGELHSVSSSIAAAAPGVFASPHSSWP